MNFNQTFELFKDKYNSLDYGIAERDFPALCIYKGERRHKVVDIYRTMNKYGKSYFVIYKKKPVNDRKSGIYKDV